MVFAAFLSMGILTGSGDVVVAEVELNNSSPSRSGFTAEATCQKKGGKMQPFHVPDDHELDEAIWGARNCDDEFLCRDCHEYHIALFAMGDNQFIAACPKCLLRRISEMREKRGVLPLRVEALEFDACDELKFQDDKRRREAEGIPYPTFSCSVCGKQISQKETRYFFKPGEFESPPYCITCREVLASQFSDTGEDAEQK